MRRLAGCGARAAGVEERAGAGARDLARGGGRGEDVRRGGLAGGFGAGVDLGGRAIITVEGVVGRWWGGERGGARNREDSTLI